MGKSITNYLKRKRKRLWSRFKELNSWWGLATGVVTILLVQGIKLLFPGLQLPVIIPGLLFFVLIIWMYWPELMGKEKKTEFFNDQFEFRDKGDETIAAAIEGIFSFSKSRPYYIHVTPPNDEISEILREIESKGFIHIHGKPGEGKSMLAFQIVYRLLQSERYFCYSLNLNKLSEKNSEVIPELLNELDVLSCQFDYRTRKLILVDDAHRLPFQHDLEQIFRTEAEQGNGRYIWISTDLDPFDKLNTNKGDLNIDFRTYYPKLVRELYRSGHPAVERLMANKFPHLDKAIRDAEAGIIRNAWVFNFAASNGFERLKEDISRLSSEEKYMLYILSCYTAMTGESPLPVTEFYSYCIKFPPAWFHLSFKEFKEVLIALFEQKAESPGSAKRRMMLRFERGEGNNEYVESLHFLFATNYLKEIFVSVSETLRHEMLNGARALLNEHWIRFRYMNVFTYSIRADAKVFFRQNADWWKNYFEHLQVEHLRQLGLVVNNMLAVDAPLVDELFTADYFQRQAGFFERILINRFSSLASFIHSFPLKQKGEIQTALHITHLSGQIMQVREENLQQAAELINATGIRKKELLDILVGSPQLDNIINVLRHTTIEGMGQAAVFIDAFGARKNEILSKLIDSNYAVAFTNETLKASLKNIHNAAHLLYATEGHNKILIDTIVTRGGLDIIAEKFSGARIEQFSSLESVITAFGSYNEELMDRWVDKMGVDNFISEFSRIDSRTVSQAAGIINSFSRRREDLLRALMKSEGYIKICEEIRNAGIENLNQTADIISAFGPAKKELVQWLDFGKLNEQINEWTPQKLQTIFKFFGSLEEDSQKILLPFSEMKFMALVPMLKGQEVRAFTAIFSILPAAIQLSMLNRIDWLSLLDKSPVNHPLYLNNIARIILYYFKSCKGNPETFDRATLREFVKKNDKAIRYMLNMTRSGNYGQLYYSILALAIIDKDKTVEILRDSLVSVCDHFEIYKGVRGYISKLFYLIYVIDPDLIFKMVLNTTVLTALKDCLRSREMMREPERYRALIKAIRNSNRQLWEAEFLTDPEIRSNISGYDLAEIYREQNADREKMYQLGLDFFKLDFINDVRENVDS